MARKRKKSHFKSRRKSRGIGGFKVGKVSNMLTDAASLGAGAVIGELAIAKIPFPATFMGQSTEKFAGLKAVAAGVLIKMLVPKNKMADDAAKVAIGVGIAQTVKGFGLIKGIYGDPLQGTDPFDQISGPYDRAEGEPGSPLSGSEYPQY